MATYTLKNIDNKYNSYYQIIEFYDKFKDEIFENIDIHLDQWFGANMSAVLGGVLDLLVDNLNTINFTIQNLDTENVLQRNGFLSHYGHPTVYDDRHSTIKYLKIKPSDGRFFNSYIIEEFINRPELPVMTKGLKKRITEYIYELFVNAKDHSGTKFIYTCGQFYPGKNRIEFTIADTGKGFKQVVNDALLTNFTSIQAIKWALQDRNTTKKDISGGIGLAILIEFIKLNKGKLQIISGNGLYQYDEEGVHISKFPHNFPGSLINVSICTDDNTSYALKEEIDNNDLF
ncbi:MAG: ATP-binding protein [Candidatus Delongbacteria bacterium]|jgi:signal transduction histidine kinase|nr:ATP-binding protein [Candidatus Delongbacteria bacterium]